MEKVVNRRHIHQTIHTVRETTKWMCISNEFDKSPQVLPMVVLLHQSELRDSWYCL